MRKLIMAIALAWFGLPPQASAQTALTLEAGPSVRRVDPSPHAGWAVLALRNFRLVMKGGVTSNDA